MSTTTANDTVLPDGTTLHSAEEYQRFLDRRKGATPSPSPARDTGEVEKALAESNLVTAEEHEFSARQLEEAGSTEAAIQSWHRAAVAHARAGNAGGVVAAIKEAERLAGHRDFAPALERGRNAGDGTVFFGAAGYAHQFENQAGDENGHQTGQVFFGQGAE